MLICELSWFTVIFISLSLSLGDLSVRTCNSFSVSFAHAEVWSLFNISWLFYFIYLFFLFHVIAEFDRFLQQG